MSLPLAIAIVFFLVGIGQYYFIHNDTGPKKASVNTLLHIMSYAFLVFCMVMGIWFSFAGLLKVIEIDLRGKTIDELKTEYKEMEERSNEADRRRRASEKEFFRDLLGR